MMRVAWSKTLKQILSFLFLTLLACPFAPGLARAQEAEPLSVGKILKGELKVHPKTKLPLEKSKLYQIELAEGKDYLIDLASKDFDAYLRLLDVAGKELAANDDGGGGTDARLAFRPAKSGTYQLVATSFGERWGGKFQLGVREIAKVGAADVKKGKIEQSSAKQGGRFPYASFKLPLDRGKIYKIEVRSEAFTPALAMFKDKGDLLAADKAVPGKTAVLYFEPPVSATYDVRAVIQLPPAAKKDESIPYGEFEMTIQEYAVTTGRNGGLSSSRGRTLPCSRSRNGSCCPSLGGP